MSRSASLERIEQLSPAKRALYERMRGTPAANVTDSPLAPRHDRFQPAPLAFSQQRLWFLDQLEPGSPFYNVATAVRLVGRLEPAALEQSLARVIDRHDALRTTFRAVDGRPEQVVAPHVEVRLARHDLKTLDPARQAAQLRQLSVDEALRPFDLARGPLIRATLIALAPQEHVLLLTLHHIVCDGWSMAVLRDEVAEHYAACVDRRPAQLAPLPLQYADFAAWQREQLRGEKLARLEDYWSKQLADLPGRLELPLDFPRPAVQTYRGDVRRLTIDHRLTTQLRQLAGETGATLFMVLLGAFEVLLARLSRQHDVAVGTPIANRTQQHLERLIGFFVNTLVIRGRLEANPTFRQFIAQLRETALAAYAHQDQPFERLVERLQPERDSSRTPLVQAMFVLQNIPVRPREVAGLSITETSFDHAPISNFDLTLNVSEHAEQLDLSLVYNPDLFEPVTIERWLAAYQRLLAAVVADADRTVLELPLVSPDELPLAFGGAGRLSHAAEISCDDSPIHELFTAQARRTPDAVALSHEGRWLTYAELDRGSNRLAHYLVDRGVGPNIPVGLCLTRSPEMIVGLLAILKAGGAYVPLDPAYPQARRAYMIADARLSLVITDSELAAHLTEPKCQCVLLDREQSAIEASSDAPLPRSATADDLAYVTYTSGSTGQPKGVEVPHRGLVNHARQLAKVCELGPGDRMLQFLSLSFDAAAEEIFPTLTSGATLQLHDSPGELSGRVLLDWSRAAGVNVLHLPTSVWASLVEEVANHGAECARHLRLVIAGGDNIARQQLARWRTAVGDAVRFLFAYGVTEATITTTLWDGAWPLPASGSQRVPIGKTLANNRTYVLDSHGQPVLPGVAGELVIGGIGVARGYRGRKDATAAKFLPDPWAKQPAARMYRTGDLGRCLADGSLEFLGRIDQQVKIRGYRIEPGEIEAVLQTHDRVQEAVVVAFDDGSSPRLAAYVACGNSSALTVDELRAFLAARLPEHMLPTSLVVMDHLPHLPGAKVDARSLPAPCWQRGAAGGAYMAPRTDVERTLCEIWCDVLGIERVGIHDNFFDLGGDSIRSIQVVSRAGAAGVRITPKQLFANQTVADLAAVAGTGPETCAEQGPIVGPVGLLPIQHEFFALSPEEPHHFNQSVVLDVKPGVTVAMLQSALTALVTQHDALRMRFSQASDGTWQQVAQAPAEHDGDAEQVSIQHCHLAQVTDAQLDAAIEQVAACAQMSLDLEQGPLLRAVYFDMGAQRGSRLLLVIHHLVVDAVSWRILLADLNLACEQLAAGQTIGLLPKTTSTAEWARRLATLADSPEMAQQLDFWQAQDAGIRPLPCDVDAGSIEAGPNLVATARIVRRSLDPQTTQHLLGDALTAYRVRPQELLVAVLVHVLADFVGRDVVRIELEGHGREDLAADVDLSRTVGWFTAIYPVTFASDAIRTEDTLIKSVKEQLRAVPNGGLGYGVSRWLASDATVRDRLSAIRRPEVSFNYLGQFDNVLPNDALLMPREKTAGPNHSPRGVRPYVWEVIAYVRDGRLHLEWNYSSARHQTATVERLAEQFVARLRGLIEFCLSPGAGGVTPADFPLSGVDQDDLDVLAALLERDG